MIMRIIVYRRIIITIHGDDDGGRILILSVGEHTVAGEGSLVKYLSKAAEK